LKWAVLVKPANALSTFTFAFCLWNKLRDLPYCQWKKDLWHPHLMVMSLSFTKLTYDRDSSGSIVTGLWAG
jgi:hypothetical protein